MLSSLYGGCFTTHYWRAIAQDPFKRAEIWLRHRKSAKLEESAIWKSLMVTALSPPMPLRVLYTVSCLTI